MDSSVRQYLLLLRRELMDYISFHHKNQEFIELLLAENRKRFAYLSGHGREMMQKLAKDYHDIFEDSVTTMERIQGLLLEADSKKEISSKDFDYYFPPDPINKDSLNKVLDKAEKMAESIYSSDIVEWEEKDAMVNVSRVQNEINGGHFNVLLLEYICFELIVNAKKNRFYKTRAFSQVYGEEAVDFSNNSISLSISYDDVTKSFSINVTGTGSRIWDSTLKIINANEQIKKNDDISGLDLIIQLIKIFDNSNKVIISTNKFDGPIYNNTVTVQINCRSYAKR
jgi:hypothetical protein